MRLGRLQVITNNPSTTPKDEMIVPQKSCISPNSHIDYVDMATSTCTPATPAATNFPRHMGGGIGLLDVLAKYLSDRASSQLMSSGAACAPRRRPMNALVPRVNQRSTACGVAATPISTTVRNRAATDNRQTPPVVIRAAPWRHPSWFLAAGGLRC